MSSAGRVPEGVMPHSLRIVVQLIREAPSDRSVYRLVVYGDTHRYQPARFDRVEEVLKVLRLAVPTFDPATIAVDPSERRTWIIRTGDFELNDEQLRRLGEA